MIKKIVNAFRPVKALPQVQHVILHIGSPKCGSSAIQRFCIKNKEKLLELGYYYPEHSLDSNGVSGGHTQVAGALIKSDIELARKNLNAWLSEAKARNATLLLSAEAFYGQHNAVAELCEDVNVTVIAFLRHPVDYLLANHNQGIKRHMETRRLSELLPVQLSQQTDHLAGLPLLHWADKFGDDNCIFMPYQSPSAGDPPIELQFLMAAGMSEKDAKALTKSLDQITNRSCVKSALELKRLLNTVLPELPAQYAHEIDWALQSYSDSATDEHANLPPIKNHLITLHIRYFGFTKDIANTSEHQLAVIQNIASITDKTAQQDLGRRIALSWKKFGVQIANKYESKKVDSPYI